MKTLKLYISSILLNLLMLACFQQSNAQFISDPNHTTTLVEHFSNEYYFNIDNINYNLYQKLAGQGNRVAFIQYQTHYGGADPIWVADPDDANVRILTYSLGYSNQMRANGGSSLGISSANLDTTAINGIYQQAPNFQLTLQPPQITGGTLNVVGTVKALVDLPNMAEYSIFAAVVDRSVSNANGFERRHILRKMLPNSSGDYFNRTWAVGDSQNVNYSWVIPNYLLSADLGVVFFIQNTVTKEVYQTVSSFPTVLPSALAPKSLIKGRIFNDTNGNCVDDNEAGNANWLIKIEGGTTIDYAWTDSTGAYEFGVDGGAYQIECIPPNTLLWQTCPSTQAISVMGNNDTTIVDFAAQPIWNTADLTVDISASHLRRCGTGRYHVAYTNQGTANAPNTNIEIKLDDYLTFAGSNANWVSQGNNIYSFDVGTVNVGDKNSFWIDVNVACATTVIGQAHCTNAKITSTATSSGWTHPLWSGASLKAEVTCLSDSVAFTLKNVGIAAMPTASEFFITEDDIMLRTDGSQLPPNGDTTITLPANDATYYLYLEQPEYNPTGDWVAVVIEGCGTTGNFDTGLVNQFPLGEDNRFTDIDCQENIMSTFESSQRGYPKGYRSQHFIKNEDYIEYHIHFQNTNAVEINRIIIENNLSPHLDIETLTLSASSAPVSLQIINGETLMFVMDSINLPPASVNEAASHGFIRFRVKPKTNLPLGTRIENQPNIYFGYYPPIQSNLVYHTIGKDFIETNFVSQQPRVIDYKVSVFPNPFGEQTTIRLDQPTNLSMMRLRVFDYQGREVRNQEYANTREVSFEKGNLSKGIYFYRLETSEGTVLATGKMMVN